MVPEDAAPTIRRIRGVYRDRLSHRHELRAELDGDLEARTDSEVILHMLEAEYDGDFVRAVGHVLALEIHFVPTLRVTFQALNHLVQTLL